MNPSWHDEFDDTFMRRKVLVTGATGFLGWHLCTLLVDLGAEVVGVSRSASRTKLPPGVQADAINLNLVDDAIALVERTRPDYIFHLAGLVTADRSPDLVLPMLFGNLVGTVHVLHAALKVACKRVVQLGSSEEIGSVDGESWIVPTSPYAAAKAAGSSYGRMFNRLYGLPVVIARPFLVYGPRQAGSKLIPYTILSLLRGETPLLTSGGQVRDAIFVTDLVRGILYSALSDAAVGQTLDLGSGVSHSVREIVQVIVELMGSKISPQFDKVPQRSEEQRHVADIARTREIIAWEPRWQLKDGLRETIAWYRREARESG